MSQPDSLEQLLEYCDGCEEEVLTYLPDPDGEKECCIHCGRTVSL